MVNIGLFSINLIADGGWWFYRPLLIWGIGLIVHAVYVHLVSAWEQREITKLEEDYRSSPQSPLLSLKLAGGDVPLELERGGEKCS